LKARAGREKEWTYLKRHLNVVIHRASIVGASRIMVSAVNTSSLLDGCVGGWVSSWSIGGWVCKCARVGWRWIGGLVGW
jgi:hypothetical protein